MRAMIGGVCHEPGSLKLDFFGSVHCLRCRAWKLNGGSKGKLQLGRVVEMSGFEVAGLVLGSISLLISGLEHYSKSVHRPFVMMDG